VCGALRAAGATAVLVTHDQQEALGAADVVAVLRDGRVVQAAPPQEVYAEPADLGVATFVGDAVVLPATVRSGRAATPLGVLAVHGPDGTGAVMLRPEQIRVRPDGAAAVVVQVVFHGHDTTVVLDVAGHTVRSRTAASGGFAAGQRVEVGVTGEARFFPAT
jgi:iron(III) transport system ATP-binding protein